MKRYLLLFLSSSLLAVASTKSELATQAGASMIAEARASGSQKEDLVRMAVAATAKKGAELYLTEQEMTDVVETIAIKAAQEAGVSQQRALEIAQEEFAEGSS